MSSAALVLVDGAASLADFADRGHWRIAAVLV